MKLDQHLHVPMQRIHTTMSSYSHRREESGELDVFAATRYYSDAAYDLYSNSNLNTCIAAKVPLRKETTSKINNHMKEKVKLKQSSSPSAKLASLVSFFHQYYSSSKKKKLMKTSKSTITTTTTTSRDSSKRRSSMMNNHYYKSCYYTTSCKKRDDDVWGDEFKLKANAKKEEIKGFKEEVEDVDGWSDSSSDLFELKNFDLDMGSIRRGAGVAATVAY